MTKRTKDFCERDEMTGNGDRVIVQHLFDVTEALSAVLAPGR